MSNNAIYLYDVEIIHVTHKEEKYTYAIAVGSNEWSGSNGELEPIACNLAMDKFLKEVELSDGSVIKIDSVKRHKEDQIKNIINDLMVNVYEDIKNGIA